MTTRNNTTRMVLAALFMAMGFVLPTVFHFFAMAGKIFLPMHIPVLLCGFVCGPVYGVAVGVILPLLSSIFTGMPVLFPTGVAMMAELGAYGLLSGLLYSKGKAIYPSLVVAMIMGRICSAGMQFVLLTASGKGFVFSAFITASLVTALPGIMVQLAIIPVIVVLLQKHHLTATPEVEA